MLSTLRFIFSTTFLFVLIFSAVVITVLNKYSSTYGVKIAGNFVGYFSDDEEFEDVYNTLIIDKLSVSSDAKVYLDEEPVFERCYIKESLIESQDVYASLNNYIKTEYTIYKVLIDGEEKMTFQNKDDATYRIAKIAEEVPDVKTSLVEEKVSEIGEITSGETASSIVDDVIEKNKPVEVAPIIFTSSSTNQKVSSEVAAVAAAQGGIWPTTATYISSPFGYRWGSLHTGIDIAGRGGDPIYAYKSGLVTFSGWGGAYGYMLKVDHGGGIATWYAHCSALHVKAGDTVTMGQVIASEGTTGNSTGNHLHFEIRINGVAVNPYPYIKK